MPLFNLKAWHTVYSGNYDGHTWELQNRSEKGFQGSHLGWRFKVKGITALPINFETCDWGPPYTTDIYGADAYEYWPGYASSYDTETRPNHYGETILYLNPRHVTDEEYDEMARIMRHEFPAINTKLRQDFAGSVPIIIGMVSGTPEKFTQKFYGMHQGKKMVLEIAPDGFVKLLEDNKYRSEYYSGLSYKVEMPGKILHLNTSLRKDGFSMADVRNFKTKLGVDPTKFFIIIPE